MIIADLRLCSSGPAKLLQLWCMYGEVLLLKMQILRRWCKLYRSELSHFLLTGTCTNETQFGCFSFPRSNITAMSVGFAGIYINWIFVICALPIQKRQSLVIWLLICNLMMFGLIGPEEKKTSSTAKDVVREQNLVCSFQQMLVSFFVLRSLICFLWNRMLLLQSYGGQTPMRRRCNASQLSSLFWGKRIKSTNFVKKVNLMVCLICGLLFVLSICLIPQET